jgi:hypothetical protein
METERDFPVPDRHKLRKPNSHPFDDQSHSRLSIPKRKYRSSLSDQENTWLQRSLQKTGADDSVVFGEAVRHLDQAAGLALEALRKIESRNGSDFSSLEAIAPSLAELLRRIEVQGDTLRLESKATFRQGKCGSDLRTGESVEVGDQKGELIESLQAELQAKDAEIDRMMEEFMDAKMSVKRYLDDGQLARRWGALQYKIEQLVVSQYMPAGHDEMVETRASRHLRDLTPIAHGYLKSLELRPYLIQAFIWNRLVYWVFSQNGQLWAGDAHDVVGRAKSQLQREFTRRI